MSSSSSRCHFGCTTVVPLHRFPIPKGPNLDRFNRWKMILSETVKSKGDNYIYNNIKICDLHFEYYYRSPSKRLPKTAVPTLNIDKKDNALYKDDESSAIGTLGIKNLGNVLNQTEKQLQDHKQFKCKLCSGPIEGFRYRCVQCADYDLCAACEARGAHERHYVLRIPGRRPYTEVEVVLQKIKTEVLSESHSVLPEATPVLNSVKEEIEIEIEDSVVVAPTSPIDPLVGNANDAHSDFKSNLSQSDKEQSEQQGWLEDKDVKEEGFVGKRMKEKKRPTKRKRSETKLKRSATKRKRNDSATEYDYSIRRDNLQTYSSKRQNGTNNKPILDNRIQKPDEKATQESHDLDNRKLLINKPEKKYTAIKNIEIVKRNINIDPNNLSNPKVVTTRLKPLNKTGIVQLPTNTQLPDIPLKQKPTTTVNPSSSPSTRPVRQFPWLFL